MSGPTAVAKVSQWLGTPQPSVNAQQATASPAASHQSVPSTITIRDTVDKIRDADPNFKRARGQAELYEDYQIRMGDGWTMNDASFDRQPMHKRRRIDAPYPRLINHTYRAMSGLNTLQVSHDAPINLAAMDIACEHVWKALHPDVRDWVFVPPPNGPALWSGHPYHIKEMYRKMNLPEHLDREAKKEYQFYNDMKKHPFIVWPLWVEDQWGQDYVTVLIYSRPHDHDLHRLTERRQGSIYLPRYPPIFTQVVAYTIIDPRRTPYDFDKPGAEKPPKNPREGFPTDRTRRIEDALRRFLTVGQYDLDGLPIQRTRRCPKTGALIRLTDDEIQSPMTITHCSAMPWRECTSAERCFATVKELLERISTWHLEDDTHKRPLAVFDHLRQWVNPYQFRVEMTGICAWALMATLDYEARISVETVPDEDIPVVFNGVRHKVGIADLQGPQIRPPLAEPDWSLPPRGWERENREYNV